MVMGMSFAIAGMLILGAHDELTIRVGSVAMPGELQCANKSIGAGVASPHPCAGNGIAAP